MLCLVARHGEDVRRFRLPEAGEAILGSSPRSDMVLMFPGVSRKHARLVRSEDGWAIVDLGSKNGLVAGGERRKEIVLRPGVVVHLGKAAVALVNFDSSDLEVAIPVPRAARDSSSSGETSPDDVAEVSPAGALRLLREVASAGDPLSEPARRRLLARARDVLSARGLALLEVAADGEVVIRDVEGELTDDASLAGLLAANGAGARPPRENDQGGESRVVESGDAVFLVRSTVRRKREFALVASLDGSGRPQAWMRDVFDFLAEKVLQVRGEAPPPEAPREDATGLVVPWQMVVGESPAIRGLMRQLSAAVKSHMDILLLGETGTGKELFARMIHDSGPLAKGPFVAINCAAIPNELLEAELFGVSARVATGVDARPGLFLSADGGSIFLDEVGEMAEVLQAKLLRALQTREVLPLGATTPRKVNVQVISASNRDLGRAVRQGRFRADLYYRLRGLQFHIPPLRERKEDIPGLVLAFTTRVADEYKKRIDGVSRKALALLMRHDWPGNVRELENEVKRAVLVCPEGGTLNVDHFAPVKWAVEQAERDATGSAAPTRDADQAHADAVGRPGDATGGAVPTQKPPEYSLRDRLAVVEKEAIEKAMDAAKGNRSLAARLLGITRNGLALKLRRLRGR